MKLNTIFIFLFFWPQKNKETPFLGLILRFSNLNVLHKGLLMQDWVFRLGCRQMKSLNFTNWSNGEVSKSAEIWLWKSIYYVKNHPKISDFFFFNENNFCYWHFMLKLIFQSLYFLKWQLATIPILKIQ